MPDIFAPAGSLGSNDPGGVSTHRTKGCRKISPEKFSGDKLFWRVAVAPERLCDIYNTTGVRHSHWMGCRN